MKKKIPSTVRLQRMKRGDKGERGKQKMNEEKGRKGMIKWIKKGKDGRDEMLKWYFGHYSWLIGTNSNTHDHELWQYPARLSVAVGKDCCYTPLKNNSEC